MLEVLIEVDELVELVLIEVEVDVVVTAAESYVTNPQPILAEVGVPLGTDSTLTYCPAEVALDVCVVSFPVVAASETVVVTEVSARFARTVRA